ncbi:MAG: glycosyltransferase family 61 protein [Usitatibacter sp.]
MDGNATVVRDIDGASWASNPFVAAATGRYSLITSGTYFRPLALPITADRAICLERHRIYSLGKHAGLSTSKALAGALEAPAPDPMHDGIVFTGGATHWHYLVDGLGNFRGLAGLGPRRLYVDREVSNDQIEFLLAFARAAGCDGIRAVVRLTAAVYRFTECIFPCRSEITEAVGWVRSVLGVDAPRVPGGARRIFVVRKGTNLRRLVNEDEIGALLKDRFGFETVDPSSMGLQEQRMAFHSAQVIAGPHGAGLANALFAARPRLLVELYHSTQQQFYGSLAQVLGAEYLAVPGESVADTTGARRPDNADYRVDAEAVAAAVAPSVERVKGIEPSS